MVTTYFKLKALLLNFVKSENQNITLYIKIRCNLGLKATQTHSEFTSVAGNDVPTYSTVTKWIREFKDGGESIEDAPWIGRPITELTDINIWMVPKVIDVVPYYTYDEI